MPHLLNDNFEKIENVTIRTELQEAVASGNQKLLDKLLDRVTAENHIAKAEEQKEEIRDNSPHLPYTHFQVQSNNLHRQTKG